MVLIFTVIIFTHPWFLSSFPSQLTTGNPNATVVSKAVLRTKALGEDWDPQAVVVWGAFQYLYPQGDIKKMSRLPPQVPVYLGSVCFCQLQEDPNGESLI